MKFIYSNSSDAGFNLASEEYFLKNIDEDLFFLYINSPSIVCGKHQNTLAEIDFEYTNNHNILIFRRLSGGGTVYHDFGNINFCFITNEIKGELVNFEKYLTHITKFLATKGIESKIGKRHELLLGDKKISGNASHVFKNRVMHHGTLLFDSQLDVLNNCLKTDPTKYLDKAVKSVRSEVTNIKPHLKEDKSTNEFALELFDWLQTQFDDAIYYPLSASDKQNINEINRIKFTTWNWIYGYSPQYFYTKSLDLNKSTAITVQMNVQKGIITNISIESDATNLKQLIAMMENQLINKIHSKSIIEEILNEVPKHLYDNIVTPSKLIHLFF